jgi:two-component system, chemotaxis family, chemotaxis protein CheY
METTNPIQGLKIMLIDDDKLYRFTASLLLKASGEVASITEFEDGKYALEFLKANTDAESLPDVVFLDINMQEVDGWTFLESYQHFVGQLQKQLVIFMVSSSMDPQEIERAKNNPLLCDYIIKPVTKIQFDEIIARAKKEIRLIAAA